MLRFSKIFNSAILRRHFVSKERLKEIQNVVASGDVRHIRQMMMMTPNNKPITSSSITKIIQSITSKNDDDLSVLCILFRHIGTAKNPAVYALWREAAQKLTTLLEMAELKETRDALAVLAGLRNMTLREEHEAALIVAVTKSLDTLLATRHMNNSGSSGSSTDDSSGNASSNSERGGKQAVESYGVLAEEAAAALYGIRNLRSQYMFALPLVGSLASALRRVEGSLNAQGASMCVSALQGLGSRGEEERRLVDAVAGLLTRHRRSEGPVDPRSLSTVLYSLRGLSSDAPEVQRLLRAVVVMCGELEGVLTPTQAAHALYGLRGMNSEQPEVRQLLLALSDVLRDCCAPLLLLQAQAGQGVGVSSKDAALLVNGLRGMRWEHAEVAAVTEQVARLLSACREPVSIQGAALLLSGLKSSSTESPATRLLLPHITRLLAGCRGELTAQGAVMLMAGLPGLSSRHAEVTGLLGEVRRLLLDCPRRVRPGQVASMLHGLQGLYSEDAGVLPLVRVLNEIAAAAVNTNSSSNSNSRESVDAQGCAMSVYGLQGLSDTHSSEVRALVSTVAQLVQSCSDPPSARSCAHMVYGLRRMSGETAEATELFKAVTNLISRCNEQFSAREVAMMFSGLQTIRSSNETVLVLVSVIGSLANRCKERLQPMQGAMLLHGLRGISSGSDDMTEVLRTVRVLLSTCLPSVAEREESEVKAKVDVSSKVVSMLFYGLQSLHSDDPQVLHIVAIVAQLAAHCRDAQLTAQEAAMVVVGLRNMRLGLSVVEDDDHEDDDHDEEDQEEIGVVVQQLYEIATTLLSTCHAPLNAQEVAMMLGALRHVQLDREEVLALLREVCRLVGSFVEGGGVVTAQGARMITHGTENMLALDQPEVRAVLRLARALLARSEDNNYGSATDTNMDFNVC